jgi:hypothetical protein
MASGQRSPLSTLFDAMLVHNKERLDALLREDRSGQSGEDRDRLAARRWSSAARGAPLDVAHSAAAQYLNERFANRWHYEIAERHRVGDEAIVIGKLFLEDQGVVKTQFGRAKIAAGSLAGRSGTVRFRLELSAPEQNEDDAYRRAAENALANCVKLL